MALARVFGPLTKVRMLAVWCELRKESFSVSSLVLRLVLPIQSFTPAIIHASPDLNSLHLARKYCELPPTTYFLAVEYEHTRHGLETNLDARRPGFIRFSPFQDSNLRIWQNFRLLADSVLTKRVGYREDMFILLAMLIGVFGCRGSCFSRL